MHVERMQHLLTVMQAVRDDQLPFDLNTWVWPTVESVLDVAGEVCGTTCCALGWAALDQSFQKQGLSFRLLPSDESCQWYSSGDQDEIITDTKRLNFLMKEEERWLVTIGFVTADDDGPRRRHGFDAAEKFFEITDYQSCWLFDPDYYDEYEPQSTGESVTPQDVITRIEMLLEKHDRELVSVYRVPSEGGDDE